MKKYLLIAIAMVIGLVTSFATGSGTQEDPAELTESQTFTMPGSGPWNNYYFTYTCQLTGTLKFSGNNYFHVGVNEAADPYQASNSQDIPVEEGQTYILDLTMWSGDEVTITLPRIIKDGEFEKPLDVTSGTTDLGTAEGTVWVTYTAAQAGKVTFAGSNGIVSNIKAFSSKDGAAYYIKYESDYYMVGSADAASLTVNVAADNTYYVAVTKAASPMGNNFSATFAEYQPGDAKEMPIDATASPYETTLAPGAKVWYKVGNTEAGQYKVLTVETADEAIVKNGYLYEYYGEKYWYDDKSLNGSHTYDIGSDWYDCEHLVYVENPTQAEISLKMTVVTPEPGDTKLAAIDITDNLPYNGNVVAGKAQWVCVTIPQGITKDITVTAENENASISMEDYYGTVYASGKNSVTNTLTSNWGEADVYIKVACDAASAYTVTVEDHVFGPGESKATAIDVTETGIYTFDATTKNVWVKYTAAESGNYKISSDLDYNWNDNIRFYADDESLGYLNNSDEYSKIVSATAGTTYYVNAQISSSIETEGKSITFAPFVPAEGEYYTTAIMVYKDQSVAVPAGKTMWYKFEALNGESYDVTITGPATGVNGKVYSSADNAASGYGTTISFYDWNDGNGPVCTPWLVKGINWISITNNQSEDVTITFSGNLSEYHDHVYATEWSYNETHHWHACTGSATCQEMSDYAEHEFDENRTCICGFVKPYAAIVADGEATNNRVPFEGYYADTQGTQTSFVYPAALLEEINGKTITSIKYYATSDLTPATAIFDVYFKEIDEATISEAPEAEDCGTLVYSGAFEFNGANVTIPLPEKYTYNGGNLLVTTIVNTAGNYINSQFYGIEADAVTAIHKRTSSSYSFIPKTNFYYEANDISTGITSVNAKNANTEAIFNVLGQRMNTAKGLVIKNGQKMMVK